MPNQAAIEDEQGALTAFAALMEAAVDAIVVIELGGNIVAFSRSAEEMFGYSADEIIGQPVGVLMPEPYRSDHPRYVERYRSSGEPHIIGSGREAQATRKDGSVFPVWLSVGEAKSDSGHRFVGTVRDLTEYHAAEIERRGLESRLAHVARLSLLGEMAAGIAHEINQPLTAVANYSQAMRNILDRGEGSPETLRTVCEGIAQQTQRAGDVIKNLRNFVRKRKVEKERLNLKRLIDDAMVLVDADAAHEGVAIETHFADALPDVSGNAVQLQQVLLNLTRNAVDAMRYSMGRRKEMRIETQESEQGTVEIRVSDRGPGISSSLEEAVFHPFFTTKREGLGVGLAISRSIVEAHEGTLRYEKREGGGSVFIVSLPIIER